MGLSGVADHPDPVNYCMASTMGCKTNNKQQKDMEIGWKQQYGVEKHPGPRSDAQKLSTIKKRKKRTHRRVESKEKKTHQRFDKFQMKIGSWK